MSVIINTPDGPVAAGSTPIYTGNFVDTDGNAIPAASFTSVTLTICDTLTGTIINDASQADILNTGRGTVVTTTAPDGVEVTTLTIQLEAGDTSMDEVPGAPSVQRSLVIDWAYGLLLTGRKQVNFTVLALAGP